MAERRIVAVTSCPTGIAHTYMAAEALSKAGAAAGAEVKVETRGSIGAENELTAADIAAADAVIVAADTAVPEERFAGKPIVHASTGDAIKDSASLVARALAGADAAAASGAPAAAAAPSGNTAGGGYLDQVAAAKAAQKSRQKGAYRHLLTGVSFMIPFVVAGGILIALSFAFGITAFEEEGTLAAALFEIGARSAFALIVPVLSGYIAFSIADRPGLAPGMIGGVIAGTIGAGFLGGIIAGFLAGYVALWLVRSIKLPKAAQGLMPVLVVPLISTAVVGLAMIYVIGEPVQFINARLTEFLQGLSGGSALILGVILGVMMAFDMGGPVNKAAYTFSVGLLGSGVNEPMAAVMAAGMTPPLGLALATTLWPRRFTEEEHEAGRAAWVLGASFITEGAIPFAAADPLRVMPSIIAGSAVAGAISMTAGVELNAPHGGVFVLAIPNVLTSLPIYLVAIAAGTIVTAVTVATLKRRVSIGEEAAVAGAAA
ncbi:MAG TPA: fructose-specific PTS transporter subunit EIIC [Candidatus Limnocylindrales bacterium]|nr:fructose-specific PTS transporter subunit EIIC [Candidatus Limnocylindrales bacterium]